MGENKKDLKRREFLELAAVGAAGAALTSVGVPSVFGATPRRGGTVNIGVEGMFHQPDPTRFHGGHARPSAAPGYEGLTTPVSAAVRAKITIQKGPEHVPEYDLMLADSIESEKNGARWVFHLKKGVKFHNGQEMTSADVKYAWRRAEDPRHRDGNRSQLTWFMDQKLMDNNPDKVIETPDKYTVICNLTQPYGSFPAANYLFLCPIVPAGTIPMGTRWGDKNFKPKFIAPPGTGPFKMTQYQKKKGMTYEAFEDYRLGRPNLDKLVYKAIPDDGPRTIALRAGDLDYIVFGDPKWQSKFAKKKNMDDNLFKVLENKKDGLSTYLYPRSEAWSLYFNSHPTKGNSPFHNEKLRQAFDAAIDKETLVRVIYGKMGIAAGQGFHPSLSAFGFDDIKPTPHNIEKAKQLVKDAGYPDGVTVDFRYNPTFARMGEMVQVLKQMVEPAGFRLNLISGVGFPGYWSSIRKYSHHVMVYFLGRDDPMTGYYSLGHTPKDPLEKPWEGYSSRGIKDARMDKLLDNFAAADGIEARKATFRKVHEYYREKAYVTPMAWQITGPVWNSKRLKNFRPQDYALPEQAFAKAWVTS
ncbi:MAG: ABC transporter substrate-binding protein [Deltaproteobacteria bacterium]|jgi:ABC-type transport system substrate-binding protein|nr:ABC transporter substrate-binding protein [Deltaproteobacteria bacterium]MBT4642089.1 ABC transporter substrate-binding protein [Deltaproteobacteria bacterium]MBT6499102.1 ABC transporter substrate-binding protein [Deltaproteobacteria bacterium]MBT7155305.1 ABC transporter substrate-binding protein [Deltaproteobacteria bacterium]MBT7710136.1 ABC transporter substrate-binding protein [Deltaproteobacteria bacterium]